MTKKIKDSKIPGNLRFTNDANDQHMVDLWAFQQMTDKENNLSRDKINFYANCMVEEKYKKQKEYSSYYIGGPNPTFQLGEVLGHNYYSNKEVHPGPRTDRDQLKLFEVVND